MWINFNKNQTPTNNAHTTWPRNSKVQSTYHMHYHQKFIDWKWIVKNLFPKHGSKKSKGDTIKNNSEIHLL